MTRPGEVKVHKDLTMLAVRRVLRLSKAEAVACHEIRSRIKGFETSEVES